MPATAPAGAIEDVPLSEARQQLEVNVFGAMRLVQYVLPIFRHQHRGRIVMISSIAGRVTGPFGGWYHASKYALEALTDALRMETSGTGIKVVLVEPGLVKTDWGHIAADHLSLFPRRPLCPAGSPRGGGDAQAVQKPLVQSSRGSSQGGLSGRQRSPAPKPVSGWPGCLSDFVPPRYFAHLAV